MRVTSQSQRAPRLGPALLVALALTWLAVHTHASAQPRRPVWVHDYESESRAEDARIRHRQRCELIGREACEREDREHMAAWDREIAGAEAARCREIGPLACREERLARTAHEQRQTIAYVVIIGGLLAALWAVRRNHTRRYLLGSSASTSAPRIQSDLCTLDVAFSSADAAELRRSIASALAEGPTEGAALTAIATLVLGARPKWTHLAVRSWPMAPAVDTAERFAAVLRELAARPTIQVAPIEREPGEGYRGGPPPLAEAELIPYALLSIVVVATAQIPEPTGQPVERAEALLGSLIGLGDAALETLEVRWLPERAEHGYGAHELCGRLPALRPVERPPI